MAKFAPKDEQPFNPISDTLIQAVSGRTSTRTPEVDTPHHGLGSSGRPSAAHVVAFPGVTEERPEYDIAERLTRQMRYQATPTEEREMKEFLRRLTLSTGTPLTHSNLMRACRDLLFQVEEKLVEELRRAKLRRPINDKHALARFEARLTEAIGAAVRQQPLSYMRDE
jgi:hypothetical protein